MEVGTLLPTFCTGDNAASPEAIRLWAERADEAGFADLWVIEHLVKPPTYRTNWLDPLVSLGHAAAVTSNVGFGTSILTLPQRRTAKVAHAVASLSHLAGDRPITLGLGAGYVEQEFELVGVPYEERGPRLTEGMEVLEELLSGPTSFDGEFHSFETAHIDPTPDTGPTFLAAGDSRIVDGERRMARPVLDRIVDTGGWIAAPEVPETAAEELDIVTRHAERRGGSPDDIETTLFTYVHVPEPGADDPRDEQMAVYEAFVDPGGGRGRDYIENHYLLGTVDEIVDQVRAYEDAGFDRVVLAPPGSASYDVATTERQIDRLSELVLPRVTG